MIKKLFRHKIIRNSVIPLILFGLWGGLTFLYILSYDKSFSVISKNHSQKNLIQIPKTKLYKGEKIVGRFVARADNLGIIAIRFKQQLRIPWKDEDILLFKLKEENANNWYYQNKYYSGLTYDVPFLPFGFPIIKNSNGKTYYFEIESTKGNEKNGLELSNKTPILVTKYKVDEQALFNNPLNLFIFLTTKFTNSFTNLDVVFSSFVYSLPLMCYSLWSTGVVKFIFSTLKKPNTFHHILRTLAPLFSKLKIDIVFYSLLKIFYKKNSLILFFIVILIGAILYDIFIIQVFNDIIYIIIIILWIIFLRLGHIDNKVTFFFAFLLLIIASFSFEFNYIIIGNKAATWLFIFLVGATIQALIEMKYISAIQAFEARKK